MTSAPAIATPFSAFESDQAAPAAGPTLLTPESSGPAPLITSLERLGFRGSGPVFAREPFTFRIAGSWGVLEQPMPAKGRGSDLGCPGLWRTIGQPNHSRRVFELPATVLALAAEGDESDEEGQPNPFAACVDWALASAQGSVPAGWNPPSRREIDALFPKEQITVLSGGSLRQGEWIHEPGRLALRFQLLPGASVHLTATRQAWMAAMLQDAQGLWSLVRLGPADASPGATPLAEIDFSGAPASALEPLLSAGVAALRFVVGRLVETTELLADTTLASAALDSAVVGKPSTKDQS